MTEGPSEPGATASPGEGEGQVGPGYKAREQVTQPRPNDQAGAPVHPPTMIAGSPTVPTPVQAAQPSEPAQAVPPRQPTQLVPPQPADAVNPPWPASADPQAPVSRSNPTVVAPQGQEGTTRPPAPETAGSRVTIPPSTQPAAPARPEARSQHEPPTGLAPGVVAAGGVAAGAVAAGTVAAGSPTAASEVLRYGPGVPPSQASVSAEQVWRTGQMPDPPRRPVRVRRWFSTIVTVILLLAAAVLLFLRFHHTAFHVTGTPSLSSTQNGCAANVTGRIPTNGGSGTLSYQWVFTPQQAAPTPLSLSVVSGQHSVYVTVAVTGSGHGTATQRVTLQVLGPNQETASTVVTISC